jgi:hypothetical protein
MGLDALVYCDCFERKLLRVPPRFEWELYVGDDGGRETRSSDPAIQNAVWAWSQDACEHDGGILVHHYLGNVARIGFLREILGEFASRMPVISTKVIYSGTHGGDRITLQDVDILRGEIDTLSGIHDSDTENEQFIRRFEQQLRDLANASAMVQKPIVF